MHVTAFLALGSNLGERDYYLEQALDALGGHPDITVTQVSTIYETEPVGGPRGQLDYLNAVCRIETELPPDHLLTVLLDIEQDLGRTRSKKNAPRTIDLDILLYGDEIVDQEELQIPHPRLHERSFVLEPFAEIAPDVIHPTLGKTIEALWDEYEPDDDDDDKDEVVNLSPAPEIFQPTVRSQTLMGQRVVVTGSSSGIGRAIALAFAAAGASVVIHGRNQRAAESVANEVHALGVDTHVLLADLYDLDDCQSLVETAWEDWGPLDVWVNNAGVDTLTGEAADWSYSAKLQALLEVDVLATLLMARDIGRRMQGNNKGLILNMGWDKADTGMEGDSGELFAATKGAVMSFTKSLALSLAPQVRVNCLAPGWIRTAWGEDASDYWQNRVHRETPLERWGTPEDVAGVACWLASPAAAFVTGQIIRINGGAVR